MTDFNGTMNLTLKGKKALAAMLQGEAVPPPVTTSLPAPTSSRQHPRHPGTSGSNGNMEVSSMNVIDENDELGPAGGKHRKKNSSGQINAASFNGTMTKKKKGTKRRRRDRGEAGGIGSGGEFSGAEADDYDDDAFEEDGETAAEAPGAVKAHNGKGGGSNKNGGKDIGGAAHDWANSAALDILGSPGVAPGGASNNPMNLTLRGRKAMREFGGEFGSDASPAHDHRSNAGTSSAMGSLPPLAAGGGVPSRSTSKNPAGRDGDESQNGSIVSLPEIGGGRRSHSSNPPPLHHHLGHGGHHVPNPSDTMLTVQEATLQGLGPPPDRNSVPTEAKFDL